ncbi:hypothetical protein A9R05_40150 (plasmid) [Burkholderia sp. KK1]|nr:hypothetical protein A9R05_40150 [Burkholderia sp. KK1]
MKEKNERSNAPTGDESSELRRFYRKLILHYVFCTRRPEYPFKSTTEESKSPKETIDKETIEKYASDARGLVQHEDVVQNYRFTWFSAFQALLFAATAALWDKSGASFLIYVICITGIVSALSSLHALSLSDQAYDNLEKWWDKWISTSPHYFGPGRQGTDKGVALQFMPSRIMPRVLMWSWVAVMIIR